MDNELTLSINADNREHAEAIQQLLKAWQESVPTVYFLDVCAVARIKSEIENKATDTEKHRTHINWLRRIDQPQNAISYLVAHIEKSTNFDKFRSLDAIMAEASYDLSIIRAFFTQARIMETADFVTGYTDAVGESLPETLGPSYLRFLEFANSCGLHQPISPSQRQPVAKKLRAAALRNGISTSHPVVVITLAVLYRCSSAHHVMKFKQSPEAFSASNALGDIMALTRAGSFFQSMSTRDAPYKRSRLVSDDENLMILEDIIKLSFQSTVVTDEGLEHDNGMSPDVRRLFPAPFDECDEEIGKLKALIIGRENTA